MNRAVPLTKGAAIGVQRLVDRIDQIGGEKDET